MIFLCKSNNFSYHKNDAGAVDIDTYWFSGCVQCCDHGDYEDADCWLVHSDGNWIVGDNEDNGGTNIITVLHGSNETNGLDRDIVCLSKTCCVIFHFRVLVSTLQSSLVGVFSVGAAKSGQSLYTGLMQDIRVYHGILDSL